LGQTVSMLGSQVTVVALPLTAILTLHATAGQMGTLRMVGTLPFLLFGLLAGAWVERRSRLVVLALSSVGQCALLAAIPAFALAGHLSILLLYVVAFLVGILTTLFDVAYQAFLPALVHDESLVDANSKLETSRSTAQVIGPGVGGLLVTAIGAPLAILVDAVSFLFCAAMLRSIPDPQSAPRPATGSSLAQEAWEGLLALLRQPLLRAITIASTVVNLVVALGVPIVVLYLVRTLDLSPTLVGLTIGLSGFGGVLGAIAGGQVSRRLPVPLILALGLALCGAGSLLTASARGPQAMVAAMAIAGLVAWGFGVPFYNVNQVSLRQALTPARLQARVHATNRTLSWGAIPLGAFLGGQLAEHVGLRATLAVSGAGVLVTAVAVYFGVLLAGSRRPSAPDPPA
jgi:predicted MFS family arabinose efflux permease